MRIRIVGQSTDGAVVVLVIRIRLAMARCTEGLGWKGLGGRKEGRMGYLKWTA